MFRSYIYWRIYIYIYFKKVFANNITIKTEKNRHNINYNNKNSIEKRVPKIDKFSDKKNKRLQKANTEDNSITWRKTEIYIVKHFITVNIPQYK